VADHFYSVAEVGQTVERKAANIVVGTSSTGANSIELRVTDAAISKMQLYAYLEWLADLLQSSGEGVFVAGTLL